MKSSFCHQNQYDPKCSQQPLNWAKRTTKYQNYIEMNQIYQNNIKIQMKNYIELIMMIHHYHHQTI